MFIFGHLYICEFNTFAKFANIKGFTVIVDVVTYFLTS